MTRGYGAAGTRGTHDPKGSEEDWTRTLEVQNTVAAITYVRESEGTE